jgi:hypothetical protein
MQEYSFSKISFASFSLMVLSLIDDNSSILLGSIWDLEIAV